VLDVEPREPTTKHAVSLEQVERWLGSSSSSPLEASKKAKLKTILVRTDQRVGDQRRQRSLR
jgi:hypothetical protein